MGLIYLMTKILEKMWCLHLFWFWSIGLLFLPCPKLPDKWCHSHCFDLVGQREWILL